MKVICDRAALLNAMNVVGGVVAGRTPTPVLRCVKLVAEDPSGGAGGGGGALTLAATDLEVALRLPVAQVQIEEAGHALIPADKLSQIVSTCEDPTITIESDGNTVHLRAGGSHFKVFGYDPKEFPPVRDFGEATVDCEIPAGVLHTLIHRTLFAAAAEHSRYAINGVLFERQGKRIRLVATDGRRLALARGECRALSGGGGGGGGGGGASGGGESKSSCIIPTKALKLITRLVDDPDAPVRIAIEENQILISVGEGADAAVLTSNLVEGAFPPFEDVIPKDQDKKVSFDVEILSSAVRRAALLTNEESKGVRMAFADKKLRVTSRAPEMGEAEIEVELDDYQGEPVEIGFNPSFITDALKVVDRGQVMVELKAPNKPGVLKAGSEFTYVLMPVNLQ